MRWHGLQGLRDHLVPIGKFKPRERNERDHPPEQLAVLVTVLERFGQRRALTHGPGFRVVTGNGVLAAAAQLGWTHLASMSLPRGETTAALDAFAVADNRVGDLSSFLPDPLRETLELVDASGEFDLADLGFSADDLEPDKAKDEAHPPPDAGPAAPIKVTRGQREVFERAATAVRADTGDDDMPEGRVLELICADFLA